MAYDIPHFSQLALIGYSRAQIHLADGYFELNQGYPGRWRTSISVDSETSNSLSFAGGAKTLTLLNGRLKLTINGSSISCMFYNECNFYANTSFQLTAKTAGNEILQGCSITKTITVLIFGMDSPFLGCNFYQFHVGEMVNTTIGAATFYADSPDTAGGGVCYPCAGGSGGTGIGNKDGKFSGLTYINHEGTIRISGIASRPGLYAVWVTNKSNGPQAGGVKNEFGGDTATDVIIISIYERYHRGDLALIVPSAVAGYDDESALRLVHHNYSGNAFTFPYVYRAKFSYNSNSDCWDGVYNYVNGQTIQHYEYRIVPTRQSNAKATTGNWNFYARYWYDNPSAYTLFDSAPCRGLIDEKPPKQGWGNSAFVLSGGDLKYIHDNGFFSYAGVKEITIDDVKYYVRYYQQQIRYTPQYDGWTDRPPEYQFNNGKYIYQNPLTGNWNIVQGVVFTENDTTTATVQTIESVAVPIAPPKRGDLVLPIDGVSHSLNKKPQDSEFCLNINNASFGVWSPYHIHRLLNENSTSGTVNIQGSFKTTYDSCNYQFSGTKPPSIKMNSVANVLELAEYQHNGNGTATVYQSFGIVEETSINKKSEAEIDDDLTLRHKVLNDEGELAEILNVKSTDNPSIVSQGDDGLENSHTKSYYKSQSYTVYRPKGDAVADDDYNFHWEITNASFRLQQHADSRQSNSSNSYWVEEQRTVAGSYTKQNGTHISTDTYIRTVHDNGKTETTTEHGNSNPFANYGWSVSSDGTVTVSGGWFGINNSTSAKYEATTNISGTNHAAGWAHNTVNGEVSAQAEQVINGTWDYGYSAERDEDFDIQWSFKQTRQILSDYEYWDTWETQSTTPNEGGLYIGGKVWFGSGRECNNDKDHCAAVFNGWGAANASGRKHVVLTSRAVRRADYSWQLGLGQSDSKSYVYNGQPYDRTTTGAEQSTSWTVNLSGGLAAGVVTFLPGGAVTLSGQHFKETKSVSGGFSVMYQLPNEEQTYSNATVSGEYSLQKNKATNCPTQRKEGEHNGEYESKRSKARDFGKMAQQNVPDTRYEPVYYEIAGSYTEQTSKVQFKTTGTIQA